MNGTVIKMVLGTLGVHNLRVTFNAGRKTLLAEFDRYNKPVTKEMSFKEIEDFFDPPKNEQDSVYINAEDRTIRDG